MCGLKLKWDYKKGFVDILMLNYIKDISLHFQYLTPTSSQYSPHEHTPIQCGNKKRQYTLEPDKSPPLDKNGTKCVQQVTGSPLHYTRAIDGTMLPLLNTIDT